MKRTPNFEKIMEAIGPEPKNTVSLDDYTVNDILDCVDTIEMFLGWDYEYETELYKSTNNDLYIKLSADPLFSSSDSAEGSCGDGVFYAMDYNTGRLVISGTGAMQRWKDAEDVPWY